LDNRLDNDRLTAGEIRNLTGSTTMNTINSMQVIKSDMPNLTHYLYGSHSYDLIYYPDEDVWVLDKYVNRKSTGRSQDFATRQAALDTLDQDIQGGRKIDWTL